MKTKIEIKKLNSTHKLKMIDLDSPSEKDSKKLFKVKEDKSISKEISKV